jgi:hypothetical protein
VAAVPLFELDHLVRVDIELPAADWDVVRTERHTMDAVFGEDCLAGPAKRPYHYVAATVSIDGGAPIAVEIRKKGFFGSVNDVRPSLKVRFDDPYGDVTRLTLNNNQQDPSQLNQCVGYRAFERAGVPAPRCGLATVTVNGESLGVYSNVESIKRPFLRRTFGDDSGELYEGNLSDFRPEWVNTIQRKTDRDNPDRSLLNALVDALAKPDDQLVEAVEELIDLDAFLTFWAAERLIGHWDGYSNNQNNFYFYRLPADGKVRFIPWGADSMLGDPDVLSRYEPPESVYATSILPQRLYAVPDVRERYVARMKQLLESWDPEAMLAEVASLEALARPHVHLSEAAFDAGVGKVRAFVEGRRAVVEAELANGAPNWPHGLRSSPCSVKGATVTATFEAAWSDSQPANPLVAGKVTFDVTAIDGTKMAFAMSGTTATSSEQFNHQPTVGFFGMRADGVLFMAFLTFDTDVFAAGTKAVIDGERVSGVAIELTLASNEFKLAGFLGEGTVELSAASTNDGDAVTGTMTADLVHPQHWLD